MNASQPLVSIIMPCFNGMPFLDAAVSSVKKQHYSNWELLIIDNGSSDRSVERIKEQASSDRRISLLECDQKGAGAARNLGIEKASGRYIAFLDCDDLWDPDKLSTQIYEMIKLDAAFSWSAYKVIDQGGRVLRDQPASCSIDYESFMAKDCVVGCLTVVFDCHLLGKSYMPSLRMRQDYALWAELIAKCEQQGMPMIGISKPLAQYRVHAGAMTKNKLKAAYFQWKLYRVARNHTIRQSSRYFIRYLKNAVRDRV